MQQKNAATNPALRDFWRDFRLTDTSIYNFYDQLIEGPNKREWAFWDTFNTTFEQRLGQNAGFEVAYDWQKLEAGYIQPLQFRQNAINIDITTHLPSGQPKPVVVFVHGFKGFKDWGHFNVLADYFTTRSWAL